MYSASDPSSRERGSSSFFLRARSPLILPLILMMGCTKVVYSILAAAALTERAKKNASRTSIETNLARVVAFIATTLSC